MSHSEKFSEPCWNLSNLSKPVLKSQKALLHGQSGQVGQVEITLSFTTNALGNRPESENQ